MEKCKNSSDVSEINYFCVAYINIQWIWNYSEFISTLKNKKTLKRDEDKNVKRFLHLRHVPWLASGIHIILSVVMSHQFTWVAELLINAI